ncbi:MAG: UDP-N-acetylmuramoyl-tripeptide--D-alanyl-D-alanine ligase [Gaiellaceae bacterium]|nr:UDP-N-acetylmuramoyl-tripeptide--D-alanyl-D-alanine ligase [Gaiellaceae bacterium]
MIPLPIDEVRGLGVVESSRDEITGVQFDSRRIEPGDLFVALSGGEPFLADARARGAAATLIPDDGFAALAALGRAVRQRSAARFVAVTGSMGKTSTKDILAALCGGVARTVAAERSYNGEIGVPHTLCRLEPDTEVCILELAMRGPGQIAALTELSRPDVGVITTILGVHLEALGSLEAIAAAKAELVAGLPAGGTAIVPAGMELLEPYLARDDVHVRRFGAGGAASVVSFEPEDDGSRVTFDLGGRRVELRFPFTARHQAENALAALLAYDSLGLPLDEAQTGAAEVRFSLWRGEELPLAGGGFLINDCWNANPVSMRAALAHLASRAAGRRRIAVLGDMAELGAEAPSLHVEVGRAAAESGVDALVAIGPLGRGYVDGADGVPERRWAATLEEGLAAVEELVEPGDAVLVKGARAMGLEAVAESLAGAAAS